MPLSTSSRATDSDPYSYQTALSIRILALLALHSFLASFEVFSITIYLASLPAARLSYFLCLIWAAVDTRKERLGLFAACCCCVSLSLWQVFLLIFGTKHVEFREGLSTSGVENYFGYIAIFVNLLLRILALAWLGRTWKKLRGKSVFYQLEQGVFAGEGRLPPMHEDKESAASAASRSVSAQRVPPFIRRSEPAARSNASKPSAAVVPVVSSQTAPNRQNSAKLFSYERVSKTSHNSGRELWSRSSSSEIKAAQKKSAEKKVVDTLV